MTVKVLILWRPKSALEELLSPAEQCLSCRMCRPWLPHIGLWFPSYPLMPISRAMNRKCSIFLSTAVYFSDDTLVKNYNAVAHSRNTDGDPNWGVSLWIRLWVSSVGRVSKAGEVYWHREISFLLSSILPNTSTYLELAGPKCRDSYKSRVSQTSRWQGPTGMLPPCLQKAMNLSLGTEGDSILFPSSADLSRKRCFARWRDWRWRSDDFYGSFVKFALRTIEIL